MHMDLISYYAKHGPKTARSDGTTGQKTSGSSAAKNGTSQQAAAAATPSQSARPSPEPTVIEPSDSDVEEDDTKEVTPEELLVLLSQLRHPTLPPMQAQVEQFNKTHTAVSFLLNSHCTNWRRDSRNARVV